MVCQDLRAARGPGEEEVMRGTVAKRLRREVYGDLSLRNREHFRCVREISRGQRNLVGCCVADERRRDYQALKRAYRQGQFVI